MKLDWRKEADYAYCAQLSAAGWAFEFLRRRLDYRKDYEKIQALEASLTEAYGPRETSWLAWRNDPRAWYQSYFSAKWKLKGPLPNPEHPAIPPPVFFELAESWPLFPTRGSVSEYYRNGPDEWNPNDWEVAPGYVVGVFDLTVPIADQIRVLRKYLKDQFAAAKNNWALDPLKVNQPGNTKKLFLRYLRILDARADADADVDDKVLFKVIGAALFPPNPDPEFNGKKAFDSLKQAKAYAEHYRSVAFMTISSD